MDLKSLEKLLTLDRDELYIYLGIQRLMIVEDIAQTKDKKKERLKKQWFSKWQLEVISTFMIVLDKVDIPSIATMLKVIPLEKRQLILFESLNFAPFYNVKMRDLTALGKSCFCEETSQISRKIIDEIGLLSETDTSFLDSAFESFYSDIRKIPKREPFTRSSIDFRLSLAYSITTGAGSRRASDMMKNTFCYSDSYSVTSGNIILGSGIIPRHNDVLFSCAIMLINFDKSNDIEVIQRDALLSHSHYILNQLGKLGTVLSILVKDEEERKEILSNRLLNLFPELSNIVKNSKENIENRLERIERISNQTKDQKINKEINKYLNETKRTLREQRKVVKYLKSYFKNCIFEYEIFDL